MKNVIINSGEKIENAVYFAITRNGYTAFTADGIEVCNFDIKGNHSMADVRNAAGVEVWYEYSPSRGFGKPRDAKWELAFTNWRGQYFRLA